MHRLCIELIHRCAENLFRGSPATHADLTRLIQLSPSRLAAAGRLDIAMPEISAAAADQLLRRGENTF